MKMSRGVKWSLGLAICLVPLGAFLVWVKSDAPTVPPYRDSEVFFEIFGDPFGDTGNLELLAAGKIRLAPLGTESIEDFDWVRHERSDDSWWHRIENFAYLVPLIDSKDARGAGLARRWFERWHDAHAANPRPNAGAWDPMSAGIRAMVLVRMLKAEVQRGADDPEIIRKLTQSIERHQAFLQDAENFDSNSNHGMWEAIALFETTRVHPDPDLAALALDRLLTLVRDSVSSQGVHQEHSPSYHFEFSSWLSQYVTYLRSLQSFTWPGVEELTAIDKAMRSASSYLVDHENNLPQIGDTDAQRLTPERAAELPAHTNEVLFDKEGGFAIFKDIGESRSRRYLVFCIQNEEFKPRFPYHFHNDMLAVYYSCDGEVVLGDQGRYSYTRGRIREYLMSMAAHNTIFPSSLIVPRSPGIFVAKNVWSSEDGDTVTFGANLVNDVVRRQVTIPRRSDGFIIKDSINNPDTFLSLWHLGPDIEGISEVDVAGDARERVYSWELSTRKGRTFRLEIRVEGENRSAVQEVELVRGQKDPYLGWYSAGYNMLTSSPVIKLVLTPSTWLEVRTEVQRQD